MNTLRILIFGDIYGRVGRGALAKELTSLKNKYQIDMIIANVDNLSSGRGPITTHLLELEKLGVEGMCSGDHFFDNQRDIVEYMSSKKCKLIRPANFYEVPGMEVLGKGYMIIEKKGVKVCLIHLMGQVFMRYEVYNPFLKLQELLKNPQIAECDTILVDFHKEATAEIGAMGRYFDGKVSLVYGTHTHIQTNDETIFEGGTGYITDIGMTGPKKSIIGADITALKGRFFTGVNTKISQSLDKNYLLHALVVEVDIDIKQTIYIEKIKIEGTL